MAKKHLPIQFFEKRKDYDDRSTEGGGDSKAPSWVLTGEALSARSAQLSHGVSSLADAFHQRKKSGNKLPLVVCTTIEEKAIAKTHRGDVSSLFATRDRCNVLGFGVNRCLLSMVTDATVLENIDKIISNTQDNAKLISSIADIEPLYPNVDKYDESTKFYKVRLVNYNNYDLNCVSKILFEQQCTDNDIAIAHKAKYTPDMTIYRVCLDSAEQLNLLEDFEGIYEIEKMLPIEVTLDALFQTPTITPKAPNIDESYPVVGVLDTGIADNDYLRSWKLEDAFTSYPDEYCDLSHGTFVSGIIEYGDELSGSKFTALHGVRLLDATVYPDERKEHTWLSALLRLEYNVQ